MGVSNFNVAFLDLKHTHRINVLYMYLHLVDYQFIFTGSM